MLKLGARKRVRQAVEEHLQPGEELLASALAYVAGKGDFAVGLTPSRLIFVRVTKIAGKPTGDSSFDLLSDLSVDPELSNPAVVQRFSVKVLTVTRSSGDTWKLRFDPMWLEDANIILEALGSQNVGSE